MSKRFQTERENAVISMVCAIGIGAFALLFFFSFRGDADAVIIAAFLGAVGLAGLVICVMHLFRAVKHGRSSKGESDE